MSCTYCRRTDRSVHRCLRSDVHARCSVNPWRPLAADASIKSPSQTPDCMPGVMRDTEDLAAHLLQELTAVYPGSMTALQLAQSVGDGVTRSQVASGRCISAKLLAMAKKYTLQVNQVLYQKLEVAGRVEQVPPMQLHSGPGTIRAASSRPAWRLAPHAPSNGGAGCDEQVMQHILQQLRSVSPEALTAQQLLQTLRQNGHASKSQINRILHQKLQLSGLVEQVLGRPGICSSPPAWRMRAATIVQERDDNVVNMTAEPINDAHGAHSVNTSDDNDDHEERSVVNTAVASATSSAGLNSTVSTAAATTDSRPSGGGLWGVNQLTVAFSNLQTTAARLTTDTLQHKAGSVPGSTSQQTPSHDRAVTPQTVASSTYTLDESSITLRHRPAQFRQLFQAAYQTAVHPSDAELTAASESISNMRLLLQQAKLNLMPPASSLDLQLSHGHVLPVSINRVCLAGSVGKGTAIKGDFDVDLVLYLDLPREYLAQVSTSDPDSTHHSHWMQLLRRQLYTYCRQSQHSQAFGLSIPDVHIGPTAVTCCLVVGGRQMHGREKCPYINIQVDLVLAPNLAGHSPVGSAHGGVDDINHRISQQRAAVLQPLLASASDSTCSTHSQVPVDSGGSHSRGIWLQESTTCFLSAAVHSINNKAGRVADLDQSGTLVTDTIRLTKAWVREGLQQGEGHRTAYRHMKGFHIELLVLKAAEKWLIQQQAKHACSSSSRGERAETSAGPHASNLLDLFLAVLAEAQMWADMAERNKCGSAMHRTPEHLQPVLFDSLFLLTGQQPPYTTQQALQLQAAVAQVQAGCSWTRGEECFAQPVVLHPLDPLCNIFSERKFGLGMWKMFRADAQQLYAKLFESSWLDILKHSSLAAVFQVGSTS